MQEWKGIRDIAEEPPCAQNPYFVHDANVTGKEHCLYLNVWVPAWPIRAARKPGSSTSEWRVIQEQLIPCLAYTYVLFEEHETLANPFREVQ